MIALCLSRNGFVRLLPALNNNSSTIFSLESLCNLLDEQKKGYKGNFLYTLGMSLATSKGTCVR